MFWRVIIKKRKGNNVEGQGEVRREAIPAHAAQWTANTANFGFAALLLFLALVFPGRVQNRGEVIITCIAVAGLYAGLLFVVRKSRNESRSALIYTAAILLMSSMFFGAVGNLQHVFLGQWLDDTVIALEAAAFGLPSTLALERLTTRPLTEWMMFAYVIYIPLLPIVAFLCYRAAGRQAVERYLMNLTLANILCYVGFMVFPVAGPVGRLEFTVPLEGWLFTQAAEWIRANAHYPGGSLPSPHCAAATVMAGTLFRHHRKAFLFVIPVILTIYVATVYGRFHYAADSITGILTAAFVLKFSHLPGRLLKARD